MRRAHLLALLAPILLAVAAPAAPAAAQSWLTERTETLPGSNTPWGGIALDAANDRLFVARRNDGLLVWNIGARRAETVPGLEGANATILAPEAGRAYVVLIDGAVVALDLKTLKPLGRTELGIGDLSDGVFDPATKRVYVISGPRPEKTVWIMLDAATGAIAGRAEFNSKAMDAPAIGEDGVIYAAMRDRALLQQLDPKDLSLQKTWRLGDCTTPSALEWDAAAKRVLIACRGDKPVFIALDPAAGVVATLPIGRGVDGLVIDANRRLIVTANGTDGTLTVIRQDGPNDYALVETIATRPMAGTQALDPANGRLYSAAAAFSQPAPGPENKPLPPFFHPDSFSILSWKPN